MSYEVKLLKKEKLTHDVYGLTLERPTGYAFRPGQYAEFTMQRTGSPPETARTSFTGLNSDPLLHVALKHSLDKEPINVQVKWLEEGDAVWISGPKDEVGYRGPGVFIAGGTGITPFMSIFRQLDKEGRLEGNMLLYANKRGQDICFEGELHRMFGTNLVSILAMEDRPRNVAGQIDPGFIQRYVTNLEQPFYVCGPGPFVSMVADALAEVGVAKDRVALYS